MDVHVPQILNLLDPLSTYVHTLVQISGAKQANAQSNHLVQAGSSPENQPLPSNQSTWHDVPIDSFSLARVKLIYLVWSGATRRAQKKERVVRGRKGGVAVACFGFEALLKHGAPARWRHRLVHRYGIFIIITNFLYRDLA